jgi:deoxyhypusine synthase
VSWGKIDPDQLPDAVVCYTDSTIAMPLLAAYALEAHSPREPKRLFRRRDEMMERLRSEYQASSRNAGERKAAQHGEDHEVTLERDR